MSKILTRAGVGAATAALVLTSGALPASAYPTDTVTDYDSAAFRNPDGSTCATGTLDVAATWTRWMTAGKVRTVVATNSASRRGTIVDAYSTAGRTRFETYPAALGAVVSPHHYRTVKWQSDNDPTHKTTFYVVVIAEATTKTNCRAVAVVPLRS